MRSAFLSIFHADFANLPQIPQSMSVSEHNQLSSEIIGSALRIHSKLGPGLFESVYKEILVGDLVQKGLQVEREKIVPLTFEGRRFEKAFRADLIIDRRIVVE